MQLATGFNYTEIMGNEHQQIVPAKKLTYEKMRGAMLKGSGGEVFES